ncbi:MAG: hypothetical protein KDE51_25700, partial [Anaerolineales bacterium]|nr:hypothetical protein [Anaerolineales bacterium]
MQTGINKLWFFILVSILGSVMLFAGSKHPLAAAPNVPLETPNTMVSGANNATIYKSVIYYYQNPYCPPIGPNATASPADAADPVVIIRQRTTDYERRTLFSRNDPRPAGECNPYAILSNLVVDDDYVYWLDAQGLARIPHTSNADDPIEHVINVPILQAGELVDGGDFVYGTFEGHLFAYNKLTG